MGAEDATSDEERPFAGDTASFYVRYRRAYPAEFVSRLGVFGRGGRGRLLDLGCGTGILLLQLAPFFDRAVGIDPEPDMLREAEKATREQGRENVEWIRGSSAELPARAPALGGFDLVTIGTAFHYMDPHATLGELQRITPGAAVAVVYNGSPMWLHPEPWAKALRSVLESRLGQLGDTDFTAEALQTAEETMRELGYTKIEHWQRTEVQAIDLDFVVGHILSATSTDQIPPTQRAEFAQQVSSAIHAATPAGQLLETVPVRAVIGYTD